MMRKVVPFATAALILAVMVPYAAAKDKEKDKPLVKTPLEQYIEDAHRRAAAAVPAHRELFVAGEQVLAHQRRHVGAGGIFDRDRDPFGVRQLEGDRLQLQMPARRG